MTHANCTVNIADAHGSSLAGIIDGHSEVDISAATTINLCMQMQQARLAVIHLKITV